VGGESVTNANSKSPGSCAGTSGASRGVMFARLGGTGFGTVTYTAFRGQPIVPAASKSAKRSSGDTHLRVETASSSPMGKWLGTYIFPCANGCP